MWKGALRRVQLHRFPVLLFQKTKAKKATHGRPTNPSGFVTLSRARREQLRGALAKHNLTAAAAAAAADDDDDDDDA